MTFSKKLKLLFSSSYKNNNWNGLIEEYKPWLPVTKKTPIITLKEGATPLIEVKAIANLSSPDTSVLAMRIMYLKSESSDIRISQGLKSRVGATPAAYLYAFLADNRRLESRVTINMA